MAKNKTMVYKERYSKIFICAVCCLFLLLYFSYPTFAQKEAKQYIAMQDNLATSQTIYFSEAKSIIKTITNDSSAINDVKDSLLLKNFNDEFKNELLELGMNVVETDIFPDTLKENECTISIPQMELEDYSAYDSINGVDNEKLVFYKKLNGVRVNVWITFNEKDTNEKIIFFNDCGVLDAMYGEIEETISQPHYVNYTIVPANANDIYATAFENGTTCAIYLFNFLLNRYVYIKTNGTDKKFYGIDEDKDLIMKTYPFDNFDVLE